MYTRIELDNMRRGEINAIVKRSIG